jgi:hypothetical protein
MARKSKPFILLNTYDRPKAHGQGDLSQRGTQIARSHKMTRVAAIPIDECLQAAKNLINSM